MGEIIVLRPDWSFELHSDEFGAATISALILRRHGVACRVLPRTGRRSASADRRQTARPADPHTDQGEPMQLWQREGFAVLTAAPDGDEALPAGPHRPYPHDDPN